MVAENLYEMVFFMINNWKKWYSDVCMYGCMYKSLYIYDVLVMGKMEWKIRHMMISVKMQSFQENKNVGDLFSMANRLVQKLC